MSTAKGPTSGMGAPAEVTDYLDALLVRLGPERMRGVYASGSLGLGADQPGRADIEVIAVLHRPLADADLRELAARCSHRALPCPAWKLELVVFGPAEAAA